MNRWTRWARFNGVGAMGVVIQLATVAALARGAGAPPALATGVGVAGAIIHNFIWHRRWTWGDRAGAGGPVLPALLKFAGLNGVVSMGGGVLISTVVMRLTPLDVVSVNLIAIAVTGLANYHLADRAVFSNGA